MRVNRRAIHWGLFHFIIGGTLVASCGKSKPGHTVTQRTTTAAPTKCVRIYYHQSDGEDYEGRLQAIFLENLVGHFKNIQQFLSPIEQYQAGDLEGPLGNFASCVATIYLGTSNEVLPKAFLRDATNAKSTFVWMGTNVEQWGNKSLRKTLNVEFEKIERRNKNQPDADGAPSFYRSFSYKGEVFRKMIDWDADKKFMNAADELAKVNLLPPKDREAVVSWAAHSAEPTAEKDRPDPIPYVVHKDNFWLVTDAPFSYVHNADRYLIVVDLLFDILQEAPLYPHVRPALIRYEDLHAELPQWQLTVFLGMAQRHELKFAMSVIPEFADQRKTGQGQKHIRVKASDDSDFVDWISQAVESGGTLIMHGWTHQSDDTPNPLGISGWDYEFWDFNTDGPMPNDSKKRTLERLEEGYAILASAGLTPSAWLTPHYMASPLDNFVFGQVFEWSLGGVQVAPFTVKGEPVSKEFNFDASGVKGRAQRKAALEQIRFRAGKTNEGFKSPYEIYGDIYGQGIVPETAGYINPTKSAADYNTVDDMIATLKRNRVIRDAWGSYFIHPFMFNTPSGGGIAKTEGDSAEIERLIRSTRDLGYEFVDLKTWILKQGAQKRVPTIEVQERDREDQSL